MNFLYLLELSVAPLQSLRHTVGEHNSRSYKVTLGQIKLHKVTHSESAEMMHNNCTQKDITVNALTSSGIAVKTVSIRNIASHLEGRYTYIVIEFARASVVADFNVQHSV